MARRRSRPGAAPSARSVEIEDPPASRLVQRPGAPAALMAGEWRDPSDTTPDARRVPRSVSGWRTYCPLRKMSGHPASGIAAGHIAAADMLREQVDLAMLGYSTVRPLIYVAQFSQPRWGLSRAEVEQMAALRSVRRAIKLFSLAELLMLESIVLRNMTLRQWVQACVPPSSSAIEKRRLLSILDRLAEHYDSEIQDDLARGRRLLP